MDKTYFSGNSGRLQFSTVFNHFNKLTHICQLPYLVKLIMQQSDSNKVVVFFLKKLFHNIFALRNKNIGQINSKVYFINMIEH